MAVPDGLHVHVDAEKRTQHVDGHSNLRNAWGRNVPSELCTTTTPKQCPIPQDAPTFAAAIGGINLAKGASLSVKTPSGVLKVTKVARWSGPSA